MFNLTGETNSSFQELMRGLENELATRIEEFACAFAKHTNLPPDRIKMCYTTVMRNGDLVNIIWFEEKGDAEHA